MTQRLAAFFIAVPWHRLVHSYSLSKTCCCCCWEQFPCRLAKIILHLPALRRTTNRDSAQGQRNWCGKIGPLTTSNPAGLSKFLSFPFLRWSLKFFPSWGFICPSQRNEKGRALHLFVCDDINSFLSHICRTHQRQKEDRHVFNPLRSF